MGAWGAIIGAGLGVKKANDEADERRQKNEAIAAQNMAQPFYSFQTGQGIKDGMQDYGGNNQFDYAAQGALMGYKAGESAPKSSSSSAASSDSANLYKADKNGNSVDANGNPIANQTYGSLYAAEANQPNSSRK